MSESEKTYVFWIGLIIMGLASIALFGILWMIMIWNGYADRFKMFKQAVPLIAGGFVFILIGLYMMKSGRKKKRVEKKPEQEDELTRALLKLESTLQH